MMTAEQNAEGTMERWVWLVIVLSTIWLGIDASRRDWSDVAFARSTAHWVAGSLLLWIVAFPLYLVYRARAPLKSAVAPPTTGWAPPRAPTPTSASVPPPGMNDDGPR